MPHELCVVVGATGAVGEAVVRRLAGSGHRVLAVARSSDALARLEALVPGVATHAADLADDAATDSLRSAIDAPVRLAVFAAGLAVTGSLDTIEPSALARAVDLKVGGTTRLLHAVKDRLAEDARFVSIAGSLGFEPGPMDAGPGTVNAALVNLMKQISLLYGPRGLVSVTIAPGPLDTPRLRAVATRRAQESGRSVGEAWDDYVARTATGSLPTADDVAWLVEILLAPQARALHGSVLHPDGGALHAAF
jgi:NAD(P)-dependent dehydrogenase (short-subunit alcohol dehydrogenase family)